MKMGRAWHILPAIGVAIHPIRTLLTGWSNGWSVDEYGDTLLAGYTGYSMKDNTWKADLAMWNYGSIIGLSLLSKICSKLGINKMLPKGINL